jgi:acetyl esterase
MRACGPAAEEVFQMTDMTDWRAASGPTVGAPYVTPDVQSFLDALAAAGEPPIYQLSPADAREVLRAGQAVEVAKPAADIQDRTVPGGPHGEVSIRIVRPEDATGTLPALMHFHGGGWVLGDADTHDRLVREIAVGTRAAVVFVNYTRSPEARYPTAIEQAYAATRWVAEQGASAGLDASRLMVVGDSVGGNMVAAVTLLAKRRGGPELALQVMAYPVTDADFDTPSYQQFADGPWLTRKAMQWFWDAYAPDVSVRSEPTASPLRTSLEELRGLPPALLITGENDVLRDEGEAYAHRLMQAGVRVTASRYLGTIHDFLLLNPIAGTTPTRAAVAQITDTLRAVLRAP